MSDNIDIKIREDGSRVVSRNFDNVADSADKADKSVKDVNKTLAKTGKSATGLDRLKKALDQTNISLQQAFDSSSVERFNQGLVQYRNGLMKHFEMISKGAKASSASIKSQMEALTASPVGLEQMSNYYRDQEKAHSAMIAAIASNLTAQEKLEAESSAKRLAIATQSISARGKLETDYTAFWAKALAERDILEQKSVVDSVRNLKAQEDAESRSNQQRIKYASQAIATRMKEESTYTSWWIAEMKKREAANAASNLQSATQRSGMQTLNAERLNRGLIAPTNSQSALYAKDDQTKNIGQRTALQTAEYQAMQRQMAMMSLLLPMAERQNMLDTRGAAASQAHATAKASLTDHNTRLASATKVAGDNQVYWNNQSREAHALARGLSGSLGQLWLTYGSILPLLTGAALGSAFVSAAKSGSEMSYQLQFVKQLGGESAEMVQKLADSSNALSKTSQYGPKEIASGYRILAQAGLSAVESLQTMPSVLNLATTGELGMEAAGLAVVGTLNAFKLGVEQSSHVADLFAKASAASQASVEDLTQSMRYGSTVGTQYKQNVDQTMAALALLAKVNITGTSAGTAYRNMLKELYTPTKGVSKVWQELGITMQKTMVGPDGKEVEKVKSFVEIINELRVKMNKLNEPSQVKLKGFLAGERGSKEMVAMLDLTEKQWDEFYTNISEKSDGFAKKVADGLNNETKSQWKQALNSLEVELTSAFKRMQPEFDSFANALKGIFESPEFQSAVDTIIRVTLTLGQGFLDAAPYLYEFAKAWLVLKAAQLGASIGQLMLAAASGAQALAGGMLAASGAMGPVARGVSTLGPLVAALGGPLAIVLGLLTAGAAAWFMWGRNAETASGKAIKSTEDKLKALKEQAKYGGGELGKERAELDRLEQIYDLRNKTNGLDRKHVDEAYKAVQLQQELVSEMEKAQNLTNTPVKVVVPKMDKNPVGTGVWNPPSRETGAGKGPSGRLSKDDNALAKLQAQLLASEKEYATIMMTGEAQYKLNDGFQKGLEIQQKIAELESMSTAELKEKGIKGREAQLANFKEQLGIANQLGAQLQANELLKVDSKMAEEVRLTQLLPLARDQENKFITFRNELLSKGVLLDAAQTEELRKKVAAQIQLNKETSARDQFLANGDSQRAKDFTTQSDGLKAAQKDPNWTKNDTDKSTSAMMQGMGIDTNKMQEQRNVELTQLEIYHARLKQMKADQLINEEQYQSGRYQLMARTNQIQMAGMDQFFGQLSTLQNSSNKKLGAIGKAAAMAQATMQGYVAVQNALAVQPYYLGMALAVGAGVSAAANVAKIAGVNFATGGSFVVGGSGGVDSQQVSMRASPGERVTVSTPTQVRKGDELNKNNQKQGSGNSSGDNIKIVNVVDPNMLQDYLSTPAGERVLVNTIQRNAGAIRNVMNG